MDISPEQQRTMLRQMQTIRRFEERASDDYAAGNIYGVVHCYIGEEAVAVGVCSALTVDDKIISTHRGHGHCIAKGADLNRMMAELYGRETGYCKGKGGSMHIADFGIGMLGANGIVAGGLPIILGAGLAAQMDGRGGVAVCFFGDGASNAGPFHESVNIAAKWKLPILYVCENNLHAAQTPASMTLAQPDVAARAAGYGIPGVIVDGNDVFAVHAVAARAVKRARAGDGPTLIECKTYRWRAHTERKGQVDHRDPAELESWKAKDPIAHLATRLKSGPGGFTEADFAAMDAEILAEIQAAVDFSLASAFPEPDDALDDLFEPVAAGEELEMREITFAQAGIEALAEEMRRDSKVFHLSTDPPGPLLKEFGETRIRATPIAESALTGMAIGAAGSGYRPIVDWRQVTFAFVAMDQIVNQAAKIHYMFGGQTTFPILYRAGVGGGGRIAAQHSQSPYSMFMNMAGLKIVLASTPRDVKGLLKSAIRDDNPVISFESNRLGGMKGPAPDAEDDETIPIGKADIKRAGSDITIVALAWQVHEALAAAEILDREGVSVEVLDPRTLVPMDTDAIRASVRKTGRLLIADEAGPTCGASAEIATLVTEDPACFRALKAPPKRVCALQVPIPYSPGLEDHVFPERNRIVAGVREVMGS